MNILDTDLRGWPKWQAAKPAAAGGVDWRNGGSAVESRDSGLSSIDQRLEVGGDGSSGAQAVQSSDSLAVDMPVGRAAALSVSSVQSEPAASQESCVPDTMNNTFSNHAQKVPWTGTLAVLRVIDCENKAVFVQSVRFAAMNDVV